MNLFFIKELIFKRPETLELEIIEVKFASEDLFLSLENLVRPRVV